jgi:hypothetical protein
MFYVQAALGRTSFPLSVLIVIERLWFMRTDQARWRGLHEMKLAD